MNWKQFLTEEVLKGCWHDIEDHGPFKSHCCKCGMSFGAIHTSDWNPQGFNHTFDNRNDLMDLYQQVYEDGKWEDFFWDFAFQRKPENYGLGEPETTSWLFCLSCAGYEEKCKMVSEFYGWKEADHD